LPALLAVAARTSKTTTIRRSGCRRPDGYTGKHCEPLGSSYYNDISGGGGNFNSKSIGSHAAVPYVLAVLGVVFSVLAIVVMVRYREYKQQRKRKIELKRLQNMDGGKAYRDQNHVYGADDDDFHDEDDDVGRAIMEGESFHDSLELEDVDLM